MGTNAKKPHIIKTKIRLIYLIFLFCYLTDYNKYYIIETGEKFKLKERLNNE